MRLLVVSHLFPNSVSSTSGIFFLEKCQALADVGVDVKVVVPVPYVPKILSFIKPSWESYSKIQPYACINGIEVFYKRYLLLPGRWFLNFEGLFIYWGIKNFLKGLKSKFDYQAVMGGMLTNDGWAALKIGKNDKIPSLSYVIGSDINVYPKISSSLHNLTCHILRELDAVVSVGGEFLKIVEENFPGLNKNIFWNSLGINLSKFRPALPNEKNFFSENYSINAEDVICLYVGAIQEQKGIKVLMNSLLLLKDVPLKIFLVGSGNLESWVDNFIIENDLVEKCVRLGKVDHDFLPIIFRGADIFLFPSFAEGSPTVLIEAAASGLTILASSIPQNRDVLKNNINGYEFKVGDPGDLAKKIVTLIGDDGLRNSFCNKSRFIAEEDHDRIKKAEELKDVVSSLLCKKC